MKRLILKKSFAVFWKRNLAFSHLAIVSNLEYRLNYFIDALVQPILTTLIEILLWYAVFKGAGVDQINGFGRESYLAYALWGAFFARITTSWMYEFRMITEIESGTINSLLVRPVSFYEYYLSQLMGYKVMTTAISLMVPVIAVQFFNLPTDLSRLPLAVLLGFWYLVFIHSISFLISCCAFWFNKIHSFTVAKNLGLWLLSGELFPLDLLPTYAQKIMIALPFSAGVYLPVGYLTGRVDSSQIFSGFISIGIGILVVNLIGSMLWKQGIKGYTGTGA